MVSESSFAAVRAGVGAAAGGRAGRAMYHCEVGSTMKFDLDRLDTFEDSASFSLGCLVCAAEKGLEVVRPPFETLFTRWTSELSG